MKTMTSLSCPQTFLGITVVINYHGTQILWAITHENVHKTQIGRGFGRNSQKMKWAWMP